MTPGNLNSNFNIYFLSRDYEIIDFIDKLEQPNIYFSL